MIIPKIIHHIAPADKSRWHPMWERCYPTWQQHFSYFEHKMWNDAEDIDNFVRDYYPQYWQLYSDFPAHIMRIDFVRFCLLHHFGGIYSDMDMFCYKNFYDEIDSEVCLLPAPYGEQSTNGEYLIENALMISTPNHIFFKMCMEESYKIFYEQINKFSIQYPFNRFQQLMIGNVAGPVLVNNIYEKYKNGVKILNPLTYNNHGLSYDISYKTKHLLTGIWGKEVLDNKKSEEYIDEVKQYAHMENVTIDNFDFYHDYTNGGMKTHFIVDLERSDVDTASQIRYD
jgi:mannosyltransferase OCH1-like enzyme